MRVLLISSDRSKRGILFPGTSAFKRQEAYARELGNLDIIAFSLRSDAAKLIDAGPLRIFPTNSSSRLVHIWYAQHIARTLPRPDVVSAQDPFETGLAAWLIARRLGVPLHIQVHTDFLSPEYVRLSVLNRLRVYIAGFILRRAKCIRVVSGRVKKAIEARYHLRTPISVLPIFADAERARSAAASAQQRGRFSKFSRRLLVVSRLEPEKNVKLALRAFAAAAPRDVCLIILGSGSERDALGAAARTLGVSERVFFEEGDAAAYYKLADLLLVTSHYEGYGLVIVEALAAGKPVLSTDVGIAREAGAIVASPEKFTDALAEWFESGPRMATLKSYPYKNFEEYVHAYCEDIAACTRSQ